MRHTLELVFCTRSHTAKCPADAPPRSGTNDALNCAVVQMGVSAGEATGTTSADVGAGGGAVAVDDGAVTGAGGGAVAVDDGAMAPVVAGDTALC